VNFKLDWFAQDYCENQIDGFGTSLNQKILNNLLFVYREMLNVLLLHYEYIRETWKRPMKDLDFNLFHHKVDYRLYCNLRYEEEKGILHQEILANQATFSQLQTEIQA
jgi:hypothetical protein